MAEDEAKNINNMRIYTTFHDNLMSIYAQHGSLLIRYEEDYLSAGVSPINLEPLDELPGVADAFYLNFEYMNGTSLRGSVNVETLFGQLVLGGKDIGGASPLMKRLFGGLTRFRSVNTAEKRYPLMVRYTGESTTSDASGVVGLILDENWFIEQIPAILDSLVRNGENLLFFAHPPTDVHRSQGDDSYTSFGGHWKQTIGVLHGADTLWWYGDRFSEIHQQRSVDDSDYGYVVPCEPFGLTIMVKSEFPAMHEKMEAGRKSFKIIFLILELLIILVITVLLISIRIMRRQIARDEIALGHLSHSIKSPVARLKLNTDTLMEGRTASPIEEIEGVEAIHRECVRLERAIQNATLSLIKGKRILRLEICSLAEIVTDLTSAWQSTFDKTGLELRVVHSGASLRGRFDPTLITIMFDNIIDNALHYARLNKSNLPFSFDGVTIDLKKIADKAFITIDDTGKGIPSYLRNKIFRRFYRGKDLALTSVSGLGLGLSIVREIVNLHSGTVKAESNPESGARLIVELPIFE